MWKLFFVFFLYIASDKETPLGHMDNYRSGYRTTIESSTRTKENGKGDSAKQKKIYSFYFSPFYSSSDTEASHGDIGDTESYYRNKRSTILKENGDREGILRDTEEDIFIFLLVGRRRRRQ